MTRLFLKSASDSETGSFGCTNEGTVLETAGYGRKTEAYGYYKKF